MVDVASIIVDRVRLNMKLVTFGSNGSAGVGVVVDDDQHVERGVHGRNAFRAVAGAHTDAVDCWANTGPTTPGEAAFISTMRGHIPGDDTTLLMPRRYDRRLRRTCALRLAPAPSGERDGDADQGDDWTKDGPEGVAQPRLPPLRKVYTASRPALSGLFGRNGRPFREKLRVPCARVRRRIRLGHVAPIARSHSSASVSINSASVARV
jgi:hypothetical protein